MKHLAYCMSACLLLLGAIPAQAGVLTFTTTLAGANEAPPNASPGTGAVTLSFNDVTHDMTLQVSFSGLLGNTTVAHIHCCNAIPFVGNVGVATTTPTFVGFPAGVTSGSFSTTVNLLNASSYNGAFITSNGGSVAAAEAALLAGLGSGRAYFNLHTSMFPGGEIRGFLVPVPEPGSLALLGLGATGLMLLRRRTPPTP